MQISRDRGIYHLSTSRTRNALARVVSAQLLRQRRPDLRCRLAVHVVQLERVRHQVEQLVHADRGVVLVAREAGLPFDLVRLAHVLVLAVLVAARAEGRI